MRSAAITTPETRRLDSKSRDRYAVPLRATPKRHRHEPRRRSEKRPTRRSSRLDRPGSLSSRDDGPTDERRRTSARRRTSDHLRRREARRRGGSGSATHLVEVACSRSRSFATRVRAPRSVSIVFRSRDEFFSDRSSIDRSDRRVDRSSSVVVRGDPRGPSRRADARLVETTWCRQTTR